VLGSTAVASSVANAVVDSAADGRESVALPAESCASTAEPQFGPNVGSDAPVNADLLCALRTRSRKSLPGLEHLNEHARSAGIDRPQYWARCWSNQPYVICDDGDHGLSHHRLGCPRPAIADRSSFSRISPGRD